MRSKAQSGSAYERVKSDILNLVLRPGQDLDEAALALKYEVSRTPIREALIRLGGERLVIFTPNRGSRVAPLILSDLPRFMEALDLNRRAVFRLAALRRHEADISKIRSAYGRLAELCEDEQIGDDRLSRTITDREMAFGLRVAEAGHNPYLTDTFGSLLTLGLRMMRLPYAYSPQHSDTVREYLSKLLDHYTTLIGAIVDRNTNAAERAAGSVQDALVLRLREYNEENLLTDVSVA